MSRTAYLLPFLLAVSCQGVKHGKWYDNGPSEVSGEDVPAQDTAEVCGAGKSEVKNPSQAIKDQATAMIESASNIGKPKADPGSSEALVSILQIQASSYSLFGSVQASKQSSGVETEAVFALLPSDTCVTQAEGSITYSNCNFGGVTFNGTVSISGDIIKIDIDMKMNQEGKPMDITSTGSVTVTDTTIGGSLTFLYKTKDSGYDVTNVVHVDYGSIEVAGGCPTSGSLDASYDVAVLGLPDGLPQSAISAICYSVTVKFGPNCGNMKVYG